jgi:two-component system response regulator AlgR
MTDRRLRVLIVDDEPLAAERLQIFCARIEGVDLAGIASDGAAALRLVEALKPDLLLLDIARPGLDGMAVAEALASQPGAPAVIFVTAFDQFAVAAFAVAAVDYLLKPVAQERLERAIARARGHQAAPAPAPASRWVREFWVPHRDEIIRIAAREIDLIEAERDYMRLHVGPKSYLLHHTIGELERKLDPDLFVRLHRSTIARRDWVAGFRSDGEGIWRATLKDGRTVRIGRSYLAHARAMAGR